MTKYRQGPAIGAEHRASALRILAIANDPQLADELAAALLLPGAAVPRPPAVAGGRGSDYDSGVGGDGADDNTDSSTSGCGPQAAALTPRLPGRAGSGLAVSGEERPPSR